MTRLFAALLAFCFALIAAAAPAAARSEWDGVARVVAIGDLEGDYDKFVDMLRTAGLIDADGDWSGGRAHLVQLGDIPDRGPNSRAIMDHLMRLERQAESAGGRVHALIGNHEAMNVEGDLRYVHPGEYAAFAGRNAARLRQEFYRRTVDYLRANAPADQPPPVFDDAFRSQWEAEHPLGYVEHRQAWSPRGTYGRWIASHNAVVRINDTLFLHAGIGPAYAQAERESMNEAVREALLSAPQPPPTILTDEDGPLWYRGFSLNDEAAETANFEAVLARHGVARIVVGHTKRAPAVLPRFGGRLIITDIAVPEGHPDPHAFLILENGEAIAVHRGQRLPLHAQTPQQTCAYLAAVAALDPPASPLARLAANCAAPPAPAETTN